jgi:hemolysin III
MDWLGFHEPISAWTHGLWMLAAVPAAWRLWRRNRGRRLRQLSMLLYGVTLVLCFGGSFLFHTAPESELREGFRVIDHIGIYALIAGTVTPVAVAVLRGWRRAGLLLIVWVLALSGSAMRLAVHPPPAVSTGLYLFLGWVGAATYFELARRLTHAGLRPLWVGGLLYSAGAAVHLAGWPDFVHGVLGPHEVFHLFVMAGAACHYWFLLRVVTPYAARARSAAAAPAPAAAAELSPAAAVAKITP